MRPLLLLMLLLAACSRGPQADLPLIGEARSLTAEWALVNEQHAQGNLTAVYARTMRARLREQLQSDLASLTNPQSNYGQEIRALLALPDDAQPQQLRSRAATLKRIEGDLESA